MSNDDDPDWFSKLIPTVLVLSEADQKMLLDLIENPPEPNAALIKLLRTPTVFDDTDR